MKANDLMVGDWVSYHGIANKVAPADFCHKKWIDEIEPIPLTFEILEKNGFQLEWDDDIKLMVYGGIEIEVGNNYSTFKDGKMYLRRVLSPLYYIHQLQHALRLCGIEKEIIL